MKYFVKIIMLFTLIPLVLVALYITKTISWHKDLVRAIDQKGVITAVINLEFGEGAYKVAINKQYDTSTTVLSKSFFKAYHVEETVSLASFENEIYIADKKNYFLLYTALFGVLFFKAFLLHLIIDYKARKYPIRFKKTTSLFMLIIGIGILQIAFYKYTENNVFYSNSEQTIGSLVNHHQKMCEPGKKSRPKYPCFARVVSYKDETGNAFTTTEQQYQKNKKGMVGDAIEIYYLKSNPSSAKMTSQKKNFFISIIVFTFAFVMMSGGIYSFKNTMKN